MFGAVTISFILVHLTGDPAAVIAGGQLSIDQVNVLSHQLGYDRPLLTQYVTYLGGLIHGDLGSSIRYQSPALDIVTAALPNTLILVACSIGASCAIAIPTALFSVLHRESLFDRTVRRFLIVLQGIPEYWAAMMLVLSLPWACGGCRASGSGTRAR